MPDLNLRNLDVTLVTRLKADAALAGQTLRAHCIRLLEGTNGSSNVDVRAAGAIEAESQERSGNGTRLPVVRKTKSKAQRLHPVQPMRDKLAGGREHHGESQGGTLAEVHAGHQTYKAGEQQYCSTCRTYF